MQARTLRGPLLLSSSLVVSLLTGCGGDEAPDPTPSKRVAIEGDVMAFLNEVPGPRIAGATVSVLEHPELQVVTGDDAHFRFEGLEAGSDVTLLVEHPDLKPTQTATLRLSDEGIQPFPVQVVRNGIFTAISALVPLPVEEDKYCVIATTAARFGGSLYVHLRQGMPGVTVELDPPVSAESGPLYFNEAVLPDASQPATSTDGGVLFYRVPPGDYVLTASHPHAHFAPVRFQCRPGLIVNAGPPLGLLANTVTPLRAPIDGAADDGGTRDDVAASDALCEATRRCVNEKSGADNYPTATLASCKATFRNVWASVDTACDGDRALRDAARAVYTCRVASCELTLGHDEACAAEEAVFRDAEAAYGDCVLAQQ